VAKAREIGAVTCGISCTPDSELSRAVDYPIEPKPGPEVLAGSTRLRAGTATKLALNMISTAVMIRLGHVYRNLMVNVQPGNQKLVDRAGRIIRQATGVTRERAAELLESAGRDVRTAIVMEEKKVTRTEAERLLALSGGRIREALKQRG
jgi:N-acetylmuramic acid 6-phosphate etherase